MTAKTPAAAGAPRPEIVAIAYGGINASIGCVLMELWVRVKQADGRYAIGTLDPVLVHYEVLAGLSRFEADLVAMFDAKGATRDTLPPVSAPLPAWDAGPSLSSPKAYHHVCEGFGYIDVDSDAGALRIWIEARAVPELERRNKDDIHGAEYLLAHRALPAYHLGLRNVLRKMESVGIEATPSRQ